MVYSLAYGDQPALICDLVDWARAAGFPVVAAGRGHKWLPHFAQSTPETVWGYYGLTPEQAKVGGLNPKMFNSFLDGSKPAIESTAVCNATGLTPAPRGPAVSAGDRSTTFPSLMRPKSEGGVLHHKGQVEVDLLAAKPTARRFRTTSASACSWCSKARPTTSAAASHEYGVQHRSVGPLRLPVQALAPDRAGGRHLGRIGRAARRADRLRHRLARRCGRDRQARPEGRRDARRRRRLHRGRQADARRRFADARAACRSALRTAGSC